MAETRTNVYPSHWWERKFVEGFFLFAHLQVHPKQSPGSIVVFSIEYDSPFPAWSEKNNIVAQTM